MTTYSVETTSGIVTSWLPLTTSFSAPSACFTGIYSQAAQAGIEAGPGKLVFDPFANPSTACFLQQVTQWWDQSTTSPYATAGTVTSLGPFECPGGYTTAFTTENSLASTQIACCPSGYGYQGAFYVPGQFGGCVSMPKSGSTMQYLVYATSSWSETSTVLGSTQIAAVQIIGWNLAAVTQPSAAASSTTATASESSSQTSADSSAASASSSATSVSSPSTSTKSSFPVGTVAGGVVGGVAVIILIVATYFFVRKRRLGQGSRHRIQEHYPDVPSAKPPGSNHTAHVLLGNITGRAKPTGHQNNMAASAAAAYTTGPRV